MRGLWCLQELKRRNVFRVGIAYAVVAWLLLQLTDVLKELLGLPDEVGRTVVLLLIVGFFPAVIFAWAFEMTPEGLRRESDVDRTSSIAPQTGRKLDRIIIGILVLALAGFAWDKFGRSAPAPVQDSGLVETPVEAPALDKSIAVLPFVNMSGNVDNEYFSDGLSEELLNLLAKVNGLKVAARTSSFKFKGKELDIVEIGNALNVATVLEGSVRRSGNQARITAQLIKVDDGFHLWSETYDRELDNIFEVQDEIARAIVDALKLPLLGQGDSPIRAEQTADFEAYDLYLLGRYRMNEFNEDNIRTAIGYFERVIEIDPDFAPAWAQLASAYLLLQDYGSFSFDEAMQLSEEAAQRALQLEPGLADALNAEALRYNYLGLPGKAAEIYEQVLGIEPSNVQALRGLSQSLSPMETTRRVELARSALALDPLSGTLQQFVIDALSGDNRLEEASALAADLLREAPDNPGVHEGLAGMYQEHSMIPEAIREYELTWEGRPGDVYPAWRLTQLYLAIGDLDGATRWVEAARERGGDDSRWVVLAEQLTDLAAGRYETALEKSSARSEPGSTITQGARLFLAYVQLGLGNEAEAERQVRMAQQQFAAAYPEIADWPYARNTVFLAGLLPAGPERAQLIEQVEPFANAWLTAQPWNALACELNAMTAALQADRDRLLEQMTQCKDLGLVNATGCVGTRPSVLTWRTPASARYFWKWTRPQRRSASSSHRTARRMCCEQAFRQETNRFWQAWPARWPRGCRDKQQISIPPHRAAWRDSHAGHHPFKRTAESSMARQRDEAMSFFAELKRRNVFRVGVAYVVMSWVLLQAADFALDLIGAPNWVIQSLFVIVVIGLPVALFFAWAFELTPEGVKRESEVDRSESVTPQTRRKLDYVIISGVVLIAAYFIWESRFQADRGAADDRAVVRETVIEDAADNSVQILTGKSIAVLPFANRSNKEDDLFFTDGIHDDLLTQLAKLDDLKVISRTSVMEYRDTTRKISDIAQELGVSTILEGGVQRAGDRIRINVQLIDVQTDEHLWAETFDRELTIDNIFDIQTEITRQIVTAVRGELTDTEAARLVDRPTDSLEAWEAYLQARSIVNQTPEYNPAKYQRAEPWIEKAVAADPGFAEAWAMLTQIQLQGVWMGYANTDAQRQLARESLERAEQLAPLNASVIRTRADYEYRVNLDYQKALELVEEARLLEPGNADTLNFMAITLRRLGRWDEATDTFLQALALDPLNSFAAMVYTETLMYMHAYDRLETELDRWLLRYPDSTDFISQKIQLLILGRGQLDEAQAFYASLPEHIRQATVEDAALIAYYNRDWDTLLALHEQLPEGFVGIPIYQQTRDVVLGEDLFIQGRRESARPYLEAYRDNFMGRDSGSRTGNAFRLAQLARVQMMLGDTPSALALAEQASALLPQEEDWMFGTVTHWTECWVLAMAGQRDRALAEIARHLDQPTGFTRWQLYLDPAWDFFRDDPRFVELSLPDGVEPEPFRAQRLGDGT